MKRDIQLSGYVCYDTYAAFEDQNYDGRNEKEFKSEEITV